MRPFKSVDMQNIKAKLFGPDFLPPSGFISFINKTQIGDS